MQQWWRVWMVRVVVGAVVLGLGLGGAGADVGEEEGVAEPAVMVVTETGEVVVQGGGAAEMPDALVPMYSGRTLAAWVEYLSDAVGTAAWRQREIETGLALDHFKDAAVPALVALLGHDDPVLRTFAARRLGRMGKAAAPGMAALVGLLSDQDYAVRTTVTGAVGALLRDCDAVMEVAIGLLGDADPQVRRHMAEQLGVVGRRARAALPALKALEEDSDPRVRDAARRALVFIER